MGQLVFQATLGGQVNLVGPNTASTFNLNVPATSSTIATLTGTETFTNKTLTSPTLTTPVLGTPASGTLTNCTSLPVGGITATGTPSSITYLRGDSTWATITATTPGGSTTQVQYNSSGSFAGSANMTFSGTALTLANDASISSLTVGKGGGAVATNTAVGYLAINATATGGNNVAIGYQAATATTTGTSNVSVGNLAFGQNTTGSFNTAVGAGIAGVSWGALGSNTTGANNTATGYQALLSNTTGSNNLAIGYQAGYTNTTGDIQAVGYQALYANTTGIRLTAMGYSALGANTTGGYNTALGFEALKANTTASNSTAVGYQAGTASTTANNAYFGYIAGYTNVSGVGNTYVGSQAGANATGGSNTFVGFASGSSISTGTKNTILGGYNGNQGAVDMRTSSNWIVLSDGDGNPRMYYSGVDNVWKSKEIYNNTTTGNAANMYIGSGYDIARSTSALKYKQDVRNIESIDITKFRPVRYKSKCANDDQTKDYFGFIADEVDAANFKEMVVYNAEGEVESFAYDRMTVVLTKVVQELKTIVDAQAAEITALKAKVGI